MVQDPEPNGTVFWNDKDGGFSGFSASGDLFQNTLFDSVNPEKNVVSGFQSSEAVSTRIRLSTEFNEQEVEVYSSEESSPLGLKLRKTPSFLNLVELKLSEASIKENHHPKMDDFVSQPMSEKLKASNFPASELGIGSWERISRHEGDLVAKCYFLKRKLVWEVLEGALKRKIEVQWTDILAIKAIIRDDEPGILAIELNQPPQFFREINPQPRKHTNWQQASDFTRGQAHLCRRHYIKFPPGILDKHYEKLLQCDPRLFMLSQKRFPSLESPYFYSNIYGGTGFSFNFNGFEPEFPPVLQYPFPSIPTPLVPPHHVQNFKPTIGPTLHIMDSNSPMSVMDFSPRDEGINNNGFENQEMAVWGQGVNNTIVNILGRGDQIQANAAFPSQDYGVLSYGEETGRSNPNTGLFSDIENQLLGDSQVVCSEERKVLARVMSMCSLLEPSEETNSRNNIVTNHSILSTTEHPKVDDGVLYSQPIHCFPPQVSDKNLMMHLSIDNSSYPSVFSDPMVEDYATDDAAQGTCHWT